MGQYGTAVISLLVVVLMVPAFPLNYFEWRESLTDDSKDAYYIGRNTLVCNTRSQIIDAYNGILSRGGSYSSQYVRSFTGCSLTEGWSIARIIKRNKGSNVIAIEYKTPLSKNMVETRWVHEESIIAYHILRKTLAK